MTTEPDTEHNEAAAPPKRVVVKEERYSWPPSATAVWTFMVALFMLGGPFTWWAVSRG